MSNFKKDSVKKFFIKKNGKFIFFYISWVLAGILALFILIIYFTYLHDLPSINKLSEDVLPESIIIYDRKGNELYNLYSKEKRTYVKIDGISNSMKDAIISTEDKTFFENSGFDFKGLIRAGVNYVVGKTEKIEGTSTISQQLIRNTFLTNERSIKRKVQELYLSYALNTNFSKDKILELYLNKISFGSNAFGIEEASKTFFGKEAKNLGILESTILASLPKGPTYYSPYNHEDRLMGYFYVYKNDSPKDKTLIITDKDFETYKALVDKFKSIITDMDITNLSTDKIKICKLDKTFFKKDISIDSQGCSTMNITNMTNFLNNIQIPYSKLIISDPENTSVLAETKISKDKKLKDNINPTASQVESIDMKDLVLEYNTGRKDFVLGRLFEDAKIKSEDFKKAIIAGVNFKFRTYTEKIKYPYFVFYVKEYLESKYGEDFQAQGGLKIYTTVDPALQDKAEELVKKQIEINKTKYGASNAALVSLDNKTGQILAMVGGGNYFDEENKSSNVNIITSERQPGSSFKPIEYAYAISQFPISPETPIYDIDTKFGPWNPDNYDGKFMGIMPLRKALDYSRNIPAIKVFVYAGGEDTIVKFANELGISSLKLGYGYGAPLGIGTGELKPIELAQAYMVFANMGYKKNITPILKIEDKKGNVIEEFSQNEGKKVFSEVASYIISTILSDASSRPGPFWNNVLTLKDRKVAAKTGTSNKEIKTAKGKTILPMDLWTAGYTPQITTVVWAGNNDGSATKGTCDGLNCAAPIWHDYMTFAHKDLEKLSFKEPTGVIRATISKLTGKLATKSTPDNLRVTSIFAVKPVEYDGGGEEVEVDSLCNGKITENTPPAAIKKVYIAGSNPIIDSYNEEWLTSVRRFKGTHSGSIDNVETGYNKDEICERPLKASAGISISSNLVDKTSFNTSKQKIEIRFDANNPIKEIQILMDANILQKIPVELKTGGNLDTEVDFGEMTSGSHVISIKAIDKYYYEDSILYTIDFGTYWLNVGSGSAASSGVTQNNIEDKTGFPVIKMINPREGDPEINIYKDQYFNLRGSVESETDITVLNIYLDNKLLKILNGGKDFVVPINEENNLNVGSYVLTIEAINSLGKKNAKDVKFNVLAK